eukprot:353962-Lingulodinium_polyedra.AAC.1
MVDGLWTPLRRWGRRGLSSPTTMDSCSRTSGRASTCWLSTHSLMLARPTTASPLLAGRPG